MQITKPFFSIIIPVFNVENYLSECLNSIVNQSFKSYEVLCINDGSTDNSINILNDFGQKYSQIRVISQENLGQATARNNGIIKSTGQYILFLDSDDYFKNDALSNINILLRKKNLDLLIFTSEILNEINDSIIQDTLINEIFNFGWEYFTLYSKKPNFSFNSCWSKCYKSELIKHNSIFFENDTSPHEDLLFVLKVLYYAKNTKTISDSIIAYRIRKGSDMRNENLYIKRIYANLTVANKLGDFFIPKNDIKKEIVYSHIATVYYTTLNFLLLWNLRDIERNIYNNINFDHLKTVSRTLKQRMLYHLIKRNLNYYFLYKKTCMKIFKVKKIEKFYKFLMK